MSYSVELQESRREREFLLLTQLHLLERDLSQRMEKPQSAVGGRIMEDLARRISELREQLALDAAGSLT